MKKYLNSNISTIFEMQHGTYYIQGELSEVWDDSLVFENASLYSTQSPYIIDSRLNQIYISRIEINRMNLVAVIQDLKMEKQKQSIVIITLQEDN